MANPTTNYGFVLPTSTDLVTDLPADFDIALQGVDTRLKALQPGTASGDLAYSSATANTNVRLPIGTAGQVLAVVAGVPAWSTTADQTPLTTKGDLFTFTTTDARLGVGANGETLVADSSQATGLKYVKQGLSLISRTSFSAVASATFDNVFSSTYKTYIVNVENCISPSNNDDLQMQMRYGTTTETGASYAGININGQYSNSTITGSNFNLTNQITLVYGIGGGVGEGATASLTIQNVGTGSNAGASINGFGQSNRFYRASFIGVTTNTTRNYTGFLLKHSTGANITGTVSIYGFGA